MDGRFNVTGVRGITPITGMRTLRKSAAECTSLAGPDTVQLRRTQSIAMR